MLTTLVFLLAASVVFVFLSRRLGLGSILGYLLGGIVIGPSVLRLVTDVQVIHDIAQFGILILLFVIGLELRPLRLWVLRRSVFGLGAAQVVATGVTLGLGIMYLGGLDMRAAMVLGVGLALSSTAIVLPMLEERDLIGVLSGRDTFAVLLFQDLATIPLVAITPLLGGARIDGPVWPSLLKAAIALLLILGVGRYLVRPLFRAIGGIKTQELFTAVGLLIVATAAAVAERAGLPASLGAFAAGVILSESEYRHELQLDVKPFEGLLLGFFFMSVGMAANIGLAVRDPLGIATAVMALVAAKIVIAFALQRLRGQSLSRSLRFSLALSQGSEFGFVLFGTALGVHVLEQETYDRAMLVVALSMAISPLLFAFSERVVVPRLMRPRQPINEEPIDEDPAPVVIAGFGRFGQIVGRVLKTRKIRFVALDYDPETIETVRRFGMKAFFGDPTHPTMLRLVGVQKAKVLVVALADPQESLRLVECAIKEFPHLKIYARARNRRHALLLMNHGVEAIVRETFFSSLRLTELALGGLGLTPEDARRTIDVFRSRDEKSLVLQRDIYDDESQLIQSARQTAQELEELFENDAVEI